MIRPQAPVRSPIGLGPGGLGCGCFSLVGVGLFVLVGLFLAWYFVGLRHVGPRIENGRYTVQGGDGVTRTVELSESRAVVFQVKADSVFDVVQDPNQAIEVVFSEAEVNSKLQLLLEEERKRDPEANIPQIILVLHPGSTKAYLNREEFLGRTMGIEVDVKFSVTPDRSVDIEVQRVRTGDLPALPFGGTIANAILDKSGLTEDLERSLPAGVQDIRTEEGQLVVTVVPALLDAGDLEGTQRRLGGS